MSGKSLMPSPQIEQSCRNELHAFVRMIMMSFAISFVRPFQWIRHLHTRKIDTQGFHGISWVKSQKVSESRACQ